jgi:hypothetical protein
LKRLALRVLGDDTFFSLNCYDKPLYDVSFAVADSIYGLYANHGLLLLTGDMDLTTPGGLEIASDAKHVAFHAGRVGSRFMHTGEVLYNGGTQITICSNGACKSAS